jgi:hypothetical protein
MAELRSTLRSVGLFANYNIISRDGGLIDSICRGEVGGVCVEVSFLL